MASVPSTGILARALLCAAIPANMSTGDGLSRVRHVVIDRAALERLYARLNRREYVHPDPLEFLYDYEDARDREVAGFVAASLSYGRVRSILQSVRAVLPVLPTPARALQDMARCDLAERLAGFAHRFATGAEMAALLAGVSAVLRRHGSLNACFLHHLSAGDATVSRALAGFVGELREGTGGLDAHLLPDPARGSACKRLHLFLRWMVRQDAVDPGGWTCVAPRQLLVPLDVHMHRIGRALGLVRRRSADARAAEELTDAFRAFAPDDPVRYDFAITRLGIRPGADLEAFLDAHGVERSE
jgi:uncharacterized protein (TIGR02757 family)